MTVIPVFMVSGIDIELFELSNPYVFDESFMLVNHIFIPGSASSLSF